MTRVVSVVTPAYRPVAEHLAAAYDSLGQQVMPAGWDWQWVVQEDGQSGAVADLYRAHDLDSGSIVNAALAALTAWIEGKSEAEVDSLLAGIPMRSPFKDCG